MADDREQMREYGREYAAVVRPYLRARIGTDAGENGLEAWSLTIEYDERGVGSSPDAADADRPGIEWGGVEIDLYRDGESLFGRGIDLDVSDALGYVDDFATGLSRLSRRVR